MPKPLRIIVCGSRDWSNYEAIDRALSAIKPAVIIHGCARGADSLADRWAREHKTFINAFPAKWRKYGSAAGPIRNREMLERGRPDLVVAFHPDLSRSKGTRNMIEIAKTAGIRTIVVGAEERS